MSKKPGPFVANPENEGIRLNTGAVASTAGGPGVCDDCRVLHELRPVDGMLLCLACAKKRPEALRAYARRWMGI